MAASSTSKRGPGQGQAQGAQAGDENEDKVPLQAIVMCDNTDALKSWQPLCRPAAPDSDSDSDGEQEDDQPWCLTPLLNVPLLAWTLESLAAGGCARAILFTSRASHASILRRWLSSLDGDDGNGAFRGMSCVVRSCADGSTGALMRDTDAGSVLESRTTSFVLAHAGLLSTLDLNRLTADFEQRRKLDLNLCLEVVAARQPQQGADKSKVDMRLGGDAHEHTFVVRRRSRTLVHYERQRPFPSRRVGLPKTVLEECSKDADDVPVVERALAPVGLCICSIEVPALFSENFDYQSLYPDFVRGILTSDLLGKTLSLSVAAEQAPFFFSAATAGGGASAGGAWAACADNPLRYWRAMSDMLARRAWPLCPGEDVPTTSQRLELRPVFSYVPKEFKLPTTARILPRTLLGPDTLISDHATLGPDLSLGPRVSIGHGTLVRSSVLLDRVRVGPRAQVELSLVAQGAAIGQDAVVKAAVVGRGVQIKSGARVIGKRLATAPFRPADEPATEYGEGVYVWPEPRDDEDDEDDDDNDDASESGMSASDASAAGDIRNMLATRLGRVYLEKDFSNDDALLHYSSSESSASAFSDGDSGDGTSSEDDDSRSDASSRGAEPGRIAGIDALNAAALDDGAAGDARRDAELRREVDATLARSLAEGHTTDQAALELKTLRMAHNAQLDMVRAAALNILLDHGAQDKRGFKLGVSSTLARWGAIFEGLSADSAAMVGLLFDAQAYVLDSDVASATEASANLQTVFGSIYQHDVVEPPAFRAWFNRASAQRPDADPVREQKRQASLRVGEKLLEIIEAESSEEEDSSEDED